MRRATLVGVGVLAMCLLGAVALAAPGPNDPEVKSEHTVNEKDGTVEFCITVDSDRLDGKIFDIEFNGSWAPGVNAPENKFKGPSDDWKWEPVGSGGWRAYSKTAMKKGQKYCFKLPYAPGNPPPKVVNLTATDDIHHPIHNFISTAPEPKQGAGVKRALSLGPGPDRTEGLFRLGEGGCGLNPQFSESFDFSTPSLGVLQIRERRTGRRARGRVFANGVFHVRGAHEGFDGAIKGRNASGQYRFTTATGCKESWLASFTLKRPARTVLGCPFTRIDAPRRAKVAGGDVRISAGLLCEGKPIVGQSVDVYLVGGHRTLHVGSFKTRSTPRRLTLHLGGARPSSILLRFRGRGFLKLASARVRLVY